MKRKTREDRIFDAVNVVFLTIIAAVTLFPFWHELCLSFSSAAGAAAGGIFLLPRQFNLASYEAVFSGGYIGTAYFNSVVSTVLHTVLGLLVTAATAYPLSKRDLPLGKLVTILIVFTMLFNAGTIPNYLWVRDLGLIDSLWALVLPGLVAPYNLIIMRNFFKNIPGELEESALIDGANPIYIFARIILPLSKAVLATVALWIAVGTWNNFFGALLYLNDRSLYTLPLLLRDIINGQMQAMQDGRVQLSSSTTVVASTIIVSVVPILCTYPFLQKYFVKGVMVGSVKG